jgi:hypothetical protein
VFVTTGNGKILSLSEQGGKLDSHGRRLKHSATIQEVHDIAIEESVKVHEFYMEQIPAFVARMIQDALVGYGLLQPLPGTDIVPGVSAEAEATTPGLAQASEAMKSVSTEEPTEPAS